MKKRKGTGSVESHELRLFIDNDGDLYRQRFMPILKNQCKHRKRGRYDAKKSIVGWMHLVDAGAKKYAKEFGSPGYVGGRKVAGSAAWHRMFSTKVTRHPQSRQGDARADSWGRVRGCNACARVRDGGVG